jgi:hypothetical protein
MSTFLIFASICSFSRIISVRAFNLIKLQKSIISTSLNTFDTEEEKNYIEKLPFEVKLIIQSRDLLIQSRDSLIQSKDDVISEKNAVISGMTETKNALNHAAKLELDLLKYKLSVANTKLLKLTGDLSIRRVIEELEARSFFKNSWKKFQEKIEIDFPGEKKNPSRKEIWASIFSDPLLSVECPSLFKLNSENIPVASLIADLYNFAAKTVHTIKLDKILIDLDSLTSVQVLNLFF